jgi:RND family efflux transporter MFP subunit
LAELDHKDMDAALAAAAASVARAKAALEEQQVLIDQTKADRDRAESLRKSRSISESEYDQARFAYRAAVARNQSLASELTLAEAQREQAEQLRENMFIRAPFAGTVISKDAEEGESIQPGGMGGTSGRGSVATIADLEHLEIECDVQEDFISRVAEGQEADIAIDAVQSKKYHGVVRKIIPMGDRARATIKVKVEIKDADELLFPEMSGTVYFLPTEDDLATSEEARLFCPTSAVDSDPQGNRFVWVADSEKRATKIAVKAGNDRDGRTEIVDGLSGSERVVVNPEGLQEGTPLLVAE